MSETKLQILNDSEIHLGDVHIANLTDDGELEMTSPIHLKHRAEILAFMDEGNEDESEEGGDKQKQSSPPPAKKAASKKVAKKAAQKKAAKKEAKKEGPPKFTPLLASLEIEEGAQKVYDLLSKQPPRDPSGWPDFRTNPDNAEAVNHLISLLERSAAPATIVTPSPIVPAIDPDVEPPMSSKFGDMTPAVYDWRKANWDPTKFEALYKNRHQYIKQIKAEVGEQNEPGPESLLTPIKKPIFKDPGAIQ